MTTYLARADYEAAKLELVDDLRQMFEQFAVRHGDPSSPLLCETALPWQIDQIAVEAMTFGLGIFPSEEPAVLSESALAGSRNRFSAVS